MRHFVCLLVISVSFSASANPFGEDKPKIIVDELNWFDKRQLEEQVEKVDELARISLGLQIRGDKRDLEVLQRIIHRGLVKQDDVVMQQALGTVLGEVMVNEFGVEWKHYVDELGRSRATCAPNSKECLFPVTMLSRRMSVGLMPNVDKVYQDAHALIEHLLPKSPYHVD